MKRVAQYVDSWAVFFATLAVFGAYYAAHAVPAEYWLDVKSVRAGPALAGQEVPMAVDRTVNRSFQGSWQVSVKRYGVAGWVASCTASGSSWYTPDSELPAHLDLRWWTRGQCPTLSEGRYIIDTAWTIEPSVWGMPTKHTVVRSNIFEVTK